MAKIYTMHADRLQQKGECFTFDLKAQHEMNGTCMGSTYSEVLRIFKEAFSLVDVDKIISKL